MDEVVKKFFENNKNHPVEKFCTCRLVNEEITYIDQYWGGSFSDFVHHAIKKEQNSNVQQNKLQGFKEISLYVLLMGFGLFFFIIGHRALTMFEMVVSYVIGLFLFSFGAAGGILVGLQATKHK